MLTPQAEWMSLYIKALGDYARYDAECEFDEVQPRPAIQSSYEWALDYCSEQIATLDAVDIPPVAEEILKEAAAGAPRIVFDGSTARIVSDGSTARIVDDNEGI